MLAGDRLHPVHEDIKTEPDHVNEVPVPGGAFEAEVVVRGEVALEHADQHHGQHRRAHDHVKAVKAGEHEEERAVGAGGELQVQLVVGMVVLESLADHEDRAQHNRQEEPEFGFAAMVFAQRMVRDRERDAR